MCISVVYDANVYANLMFLNLAVEAVKNPWAIAEISRYNYTSVEEYSLFAIHLSLRIYYVVGRISIKMFLV